VPTDPDVAILARRFDVSSQSRAAGRMYAQFVVDP